MKHLLALLAGVGILLPAARAAELPTLSNSARPFSFAVPGDLPFSRPDFTAQAIVRDIAEASPPQ